MYELPPLFTWGLFILLIAILIGVLENRRASVSVGLLIVALIAAHVYRVMSQANPWLHEQLIGLFAFITVRYTETAIAGGPPGGWPAALWSPFTYMFIHGDGSHLFGNSVALFIFGRAVAWRIGTWRFLLLFAASGAAGALVYLMFSLGSPGILVGASGGVFGIVAATFRFVPRTDDRMKALFWPDEKVRAVPLASLAEMLTERRALTYIFICLLIGPLGLLALLYGTSGNVAVSAHAGGFAVGLLGIGLLDRKRRELPADAAHAEAGEMQQAEHLGMKLLRAGFIVLVILGMAGGLSYYLWPIY